MNPEQTIRLEALKLALAHRAMSVAGPIETAKTFEFYIAGQPAKGPADTAKEPGEAAPKPRKSRPVHEPTT